LNKVLVQNYYLLEEANKSFELKAHILDVSKMGGGSGKKR